MELFAQKSILAAGSLKFHEIFYGHNKNTENIEIPDHDQYAFRLFLKSFYSDCIFFDERSNNIYGILELAKEYEVTQCMEMCINAVKNSHSLNNKNRFLLYNYKLAMKIEQPKLNRIFEDCISTNAEYVLETLECYYEDYDMFKRILQLDLKCERMIVFDACLKWAKKMCNGKRLAERNGRKLREQLVDCLYLIRFHRMTIKQFTERIGENEGLFTADELEDIIHSITNKQYKSKIFHQ